MSQKLRVRCPKCGSQGIVPEEVRQGWIRGKGMASKRRVRCEVCGMLFGPLEGPNAVLMANQIRQHSSD